MFNNKKFELELLRKWYLAGFYSRDEYMQEKRKLEGKRITKRTKALV